MAEYMGNAVQETIDDPGGINSTQTSFTVSDVSKWPLPTFRLLCEQEIMEVLSISSLTLLVVRGAEGSVAAAHADGTPLTNILTKDALNALIGQGGTIANNAITNALLAQMPANTIKGNNTGSTANAADLTQAQATALLNAFTPSGSGHLKGLVPDPGGTAGTTKFLREDATWGVPPGTGGGTVSSVALAMPGEFSVSGSPITSSGTFTVSKANQSANSFFAGPSSGAAAQPNFRAIVAGDLPLFGASGGSHAAGAVPDPGSTAGTTRYLREDATWASPPGVGTVTSVALTMPSEFSVAGSPITSSGTLAVTKANQNANRVFAGPSSGGAAAPSFRALAFADLPSNLNVILLSWMDWLIQTGNTTLIQQLSSTDANSYQTVPQNGDIRTIGFCVPAGTYSLVMPFWQENNMGIVQTLLDGSQVDNFDCYIASSSGDWLLRTISLGALTQGQHAVQRKINGKNGSSSAYYQVISSAYLVQTA